MVKKGYDIDSVRRALEHHVTTGALRSVTLATGPTNRPLRVEGEAGHVGDKWLTIDEAYQLCIGLRLGELTYSKRAQLADAVFALLNVDEWSPDTLMEIGELYTAAGYVISGSHVVDEPPEPGRGTHYTETQSVHHEDLPRDEISSLALMMRGTLAAAGIRNRADAERLTGSRVKSMMAGLTADEFGQRHRRAWALLLQMLPGENSRCGIHGDDTSSGRCASCDTERVQL